MDAFLSFFSTIITEQPALNYVLPALITALVGIVGIVLQFITSMYIQKQQRLENRTKSLKYFFTPLQQYLCSLNALRLASRLSENKFVLALLGDQENTKLFDPIKRDVIKTYENMGNLFLSGDYSYLNKKMQNEIIRLKNHVYSVNSIIDLTKNSATEIKKNIPDMPAISNIIEEIDKLLIKA
jgi:hypothetical protein